MKLAANGVVFVEMAELTRATFKHLLTRLDEDTLHRRAACGSVATISGCTEWLSESVPALTVGWDWVIDHRDSGNKAWRVGPPRTNISLIGHHRHAMSWDDSLEALGQLAEVLLPWQETVRAMLVLPRQTRQGASCGYSRILG